MEKIIVVGSGASGVHFSLSLLKKGYQVIMLDVGWHKLPPVNPSDQWRLLKENLPDPAQYFLGKNFEAVVYPEVEGEYYTKYYGFPPTKTHVFTQPSGVEYIATGFVPLMSYAQGGLAEAWTGGAYPFNDYDLSEYPFNYSEIEPHYSEVARRIGLIGVDDDLARFFPLHENLLPPLKLDMNSELLVREYEKNRHSINKKTGGYLGRSRVTTQSIDTDRRKGCWYCGRCLWGCPTESLYTPSMTLRECLKYPNFDYHSDRLVSHFNYDTDGKLTGMVAKSVTDHSIREFQADRYALAAGALSSSKIFMDSVYQKTSEIIKLTGLMDNRQVLVPFLNLKMLGKPYSPDNYQYHQLAIGLEAKDRPEEYIHGQITTLKSALVHPVIENLPVDMKTARQIFRNLRSGLGVLNINLFDRRRQDNYLTLEVDKETKRTRLVINYMPAGYEPALVHDSLGRVKKLLKGLKCIIPPGMIHIRPMGASVHYTGLLPMSTQPARYHVSKYCQSYDFNNLYIVDGSTMPFLPAKNITFTLMANAVRIAESVF